MSPAPPTQQQTAERSRALQAFLQDLRGRRTVLKQNSATKKREQDELKARIDQADVQVTKMRDLAESIEQITAPLDGQELSNAVARFKHEVERQVASLKEQADDYESDIDAFRMHVTKLAQEQALIDEEDAAIAEVLTKFGEQ